MRYLLLLIVLCSACNTIKKSTRETSEAKTLSHNYDFGSMEYEEQYQANRNNLYSNRTEGFYVEFDTTGNHNTVESNHVTIVDSGGLKTFDFGSLRPVKISYQKRDKQTHASDTTMSNKKAAAVIIKEATAAQECKESMEESKAISRVPWILLLVIAILLAIAAYFVSRMKE